MQCRRLSGDTSWTRSRGPSPATQALREPGGDGIRGAGRRQRAARDSIAVPGPTLVLKRGQPARISVVNHLPRRPPSISTVSSSRASPTVCPDGAVRPGASCRPSPGDSFVAEFVPTRAGTFIYHTHNNEQLQLGAGLYGALLVVDEAHRFDPEVDRIVLVGGGDPADSLPQFDSNPPGWSPTAQPAADGPRRGKDLPAPPHQHQPRLAGDLLADVGLGARDLAPIAKDGADLPPTQRRARAAWLLTGPGQTADFEFTPSRAGELRLEAKTQLPGWIVPIVLRVRSFSARERRRTQRESHRGERLRATSRRDA